MSPSRRAGIISRWIACGALLVGSLWLASSLPVEWAPSLELPAVQIEASWPNASPRAVERLVTAPLERALYETPGVLHIRSLSEEGRSFLLLELDPGANAAVLTAELTDRARGLRNSLPAMVVPSLSRELPEAVRAAQGFITLQLVGGDNRDELSRIAHQLIAARLSSIPGVSEVTVVGQTGTELVVTVDRDRFLQHGLTLDFLKLRLQQLLKSESLGWLPDARGERRLVWRKGASRSEQLLEAPLQRNDSGSLLSLRDLAKVELRATAPSRISRVDRLAVITLFVDRKVGSHLLATADLVSAELARLVPQLPPGVRLDVVDDKSETIRGALKDLAWRGIAGLLAVVFLLLLLLRSTVAAFQALFGATVAFALGLALLEPFGLTLNMVTLAGLSLLFGFLVDNSAIVAERLLELSSHAGSAAQGAAALATKALASTWLPALGGTLSTIAVFLPMAYATQELRTLFAPFALLASLTLIFSQLVPAYLALPWSQGLLAARGATSPAERRRISHVVSRLYTPWAAHPRLGLFAVLLLIGLPTPLVPRSIETPAAGFPNPQAAHRADLFNRTLGRDDLQELRHRVEILVGGVNRLFLENVHLGATWTFDEPNEIHIRARLPSGSTADTGERILRDFEAMAVGDPAARKVVLVAGAEEAHLQILCSRQVPLGRALDLRERLIRHAIDLGGVELSIQGLEPTGFHTGLGEAAGFMLVASGASYEDLEALAGRFETHVKALDPRVAEVRIDTHLRGQRKDLSLPWAGVQQLRSGLAADQLIDLLHPSLVTNAPSFWARLDQPELLPVRFEFTGLANSSLSRILREPLRSPGGRGFSLGQLSAVETKGNAVAIERVDQRYLRYIEVLYRGPTPQGSRLMKKAVATFPVPPGSRLELNHSESLAEKSYPELLGLVAISIVVVYLILAGVLESWSLAGIVMLAVPTAWIGVAGAFAWTGQDFGEGAFLGLILTIGVCVNNSVLHASYFRASKQSHPGRSPKLLALQSARKRMVVMWTTTLSTCVGLLPMLILPEQGTFWSGLALAVIFGLLASTLLSPAVTIALIACAERPPTRIRLSSAS